MHPCIEQLLSLRDGDPVDAVVRQHVAGCHQCQAALAEAAAVGDRLRSLPLLRSEPAGWAALQRRMSRRDSTRRRIGWMARATAVASVSILAIGVAWRIGDPPRAPGPLLTVPSPLSAEEAVALDRVARLRAQSQALEAVLEEFGDRPSVERAGTTLPIDTLEAQVQWVDYQLSTGAGQVEPAAAEQLWRERVEAMNSLLRLRYVEAQSVVM